MKTRASILVVDDEKIVRESLAKWFIEDGYRVGTAENGAEAMRLVRAERWDIILLDIKMPDMDGMELQQRIRGIDPPPTIIFITAHASVDTAVQALKMGAFDYVTKPVDPDYLSHLIDKAVRQRALVNENLRLKEQLAQFPGRREIVGESPAIRRVFELIETVARTDTTVMIRGESGTGKGLIAGAIHDGSSRRNFPFVTVSCGALPELVVESELFGSEAEGGQRRNGKLELADQGTLFLDEIGHIDMKTQMDLLRVIESKQSRRVGGNGTVEVDFRIICATNQDLEKAIKEGSFREDLYYRLNVFTVELPPLCERKSDIPLLADYFLRKYAGEMAKPIDSITHGAMEALVRYDWPGNVRELENAIERAMVVGKPPAIRPEDLPFGLSQRVDVPQSGSLAAVEKSHITSVLALNNWNISRSAEVLEIDRVTLYNKIHKYGLRRP